MAAFWNKNVHSALKMFIVDFNHIFKLPVISNKRTFVWFMIYSCVLYVLNEVIEIVYIKWYFIEFIIAAVYELVYLGKYFLLVL